MAGRIVRRVLASLRTQVLLAVALGILPAIVLPRICPSACSAFETRRALLPLRSPAALPQNVIAGPDRGPAAGRDICRTVSDFGTHLKIVWSVSIHGTS